MSTFDLLPVTAPTTLAVLLGASAWPASPDLEESGAYVFAKHGFKDYLRDSRGFGLPEENILDLFDKDMSAADQLDTLRAFLKDRREALLTTDQAVRDVLIYFVGHGGFADDASYEFCLLPRQADTSTLKGTGLRIDELAEVLQKEAHFTRRYLVLDCCFAGAAYRYLLGPTDDTAKGKTRAAFRRFPAHGSALLYSSNQNTPSLRFRDGSNTAFSYALVEALRYGDPDHNCPLSFRNLTLLIQDELHMLQEEKRVGIVPFPAVISLDQTDGGDVADIPFFPNPSILRKGIYQIEVEQHGSTGEGKAADKEEYLRINPRKLVIRGIRLLVCASVFILYWLTIGYMTPAIFPDKLLSISGSTYLTVFILGADSKMQKLKLAIIFGSLIIDWLLSGIILSHILYINLLPLPYFVMAWICGFVLLIVFLILLLLEAYYKRYNFIYRNVMNMRKIQAVIFATLILILLCQIPFLGDSFLYFPIVASVFSVGFFVYDLKGLGGASYIDELTGVTPKGKKRLEKQRDHTAKYNTYFEDMEKRKSVKKNILYLIFVE